MDKSSYGRKDRLIQERRHDVYRSEAKQSQPQQCGECGAVLKKGRWVWSQAPKDARETTCPACRSS